MITITASTTKAYFGELVYLREMTKDLVAASIKVPRSDLDYKHEPLDVDDPLATSVTITIGAVGDQVLAQRIQEGFYKLFHPARLTFKVQFTQEGPPVEVADAEEIDKAASDAVNQANTRMVVAAASSHSNPTTTSYGYVDNRENYGDDYGGDYDDPMRFLS